MILLDSTVGYGMKCVCYRYRYFGSEVSLVLQSSPTSLMTVLILGPLFCFRLRDQTRAHPLKLAGKNDLQTVQCHPVSINTPAVDINTSGV